MFGCSNNSTIVVDFKITYSRELKVLQLCNTNLLIICKSNKTKYVLHQRKSVFYVIRATSIIRTS